MGKSGKPSPTLDDYLYWQERFENRQASGLSIDDFCIADGVSRSTFYRWAQRLREGIPDSVREEGAIPILAELAEPKFLPVSLTASPVETATAAQDKAEKIASARDWLYGGCILVIGFRDRSS